MKRRDVLKRLGMLGAATAAVAPAVVSADEWPDAFERNGWRIRWHGWQRPINQRIEAGFWSADRIGDTSGWFWYSTTMGRCLEAHRYYTLDLVHTGEWPHIDGTHDERTKVLVKRAALARLLEHLS